MKTNVAVFLVFFGAALLDAISGGHWLAMLFWIALGLLFFWADRRRSAGRT